MDPQQPAPGGGTTLDPWVGRYAARTRGMSASQIRALFAVASRPVVVSLAGGKSNVAALPELLDLPADLVYQMFACDLEALDLGIKRQGKPLPVLAQ